MNEKFDVNKYNSPLSQTTKDIKESNDKILSAAESEQEWVPAHELAEEMVENPDGYLKGLMDAVDRGKKIHVNKDFFVEAIPLEEKIFRITGGKKLRNRWFVRSSCPTPTYSSHVYHYKHGKSFYPAEDVVWIIPGRDECHELYKRRNSLPDEARDLMQYVMDYFDGNLLKRAKILNKEDIKPGNVVIKVTE